MTVAELIDQLLQIHNQSAEVVMNVTLTDFENVFCGYSHELIESVTDLGDTVLIDTD